MATSDSWSPDVEVAVHGDELIIKVDHLPDAHAFAAEVEDGALLLHSATLEGVEDHCLHLPLPEGIGSGAFATAQCGASFEVHMWVPAAL